jgi:hypothetical protein
VEEGVGGEGFVAVVFEEEVVGDGEGEDGGEAVAVVGDEGDVFEALADGGAGDVLAVEGEGAGGEGKVADEGGEEV